MLAALLMIAAAAVLWPTARLTTRAARPAAARATGPAQRGRSPGTRWSAETRAHLTLDDVADTAEILAMGLRAGSAPTRVIEVVLPDCPPRASALLRDLAGQLGRGEPAAPILAAWADEHDALSPVASAWALSERSGVPLAPALEQAARSCRELVAAKRRLDAAGAGARATMWLLTALPVLGLLAGLTLGVTPSALLAESAAWSSMLLGLALTIAGWLLSGYIVRRAARPGSC